jgi:hypothetical protein
VDFLLFAIKITNATTVLTSEAGAIMKKEIKFCVIIFEKNSISVDIILGNYKIPTWLTCYMDMPITLRGNQ